MQITHSPAALKQPSSPFPYSCSHRSPPLSSSTPHTFEESDQCTYRYLTTSLCAQDQRGYLTIESVLQNSSENCISQEALISASFPYHKFPCYYFGFWSQCLMWTLDAGMDRTAYLELRCLKQLRANWKRTGQNINPLTVAVTLPHSVFVSAQLNPFQMTFSVKFMQKTKQTNQPKQNKTKQPQQTKPKTSPTPASLYSTGCYDLWIRSWK